MYFRWLDSWKGILITLVVFGHVVGAAYHLTSNGTQVLMETIYKCIYAFHMPAFFFIAGVAWRGKKYGIYPFIIGKTKRLLIPYFFFGTLSIVIFIVASLSLTSLFDQATTSAYVDKGIFQCRWFIPLFSLLHGGGWPQGEGFQFNSVLWFLPCMFSLLLLGRLLNGIPHSRMAFLSVGILCIPFYNFLYLMGAINLPWGLDRVIKYFPYFVSGVLLGDLMRRKLAPIRCRWRVVWAIFLSTMCCCVGGVLPDLGYADVSLIWSSIFFVIAICGIVATFFWATCIDAKWLVCLGSMSLGVMLIHKIILVPIQFSVSKLNWFGSGTTAAVATTIGCTVLAIAISVCCVFIIRRISPVLIGERKLGKLAELQDGCAQTIECFKG